MGISREVCGDVLYNEQTDDGRRNSNIVVKPEKTSSRPIRVIGFLLILQVIGLVGVIVYNFLQVDFGQIDLSRVDMDQIQPSSPQYEQVLQLGAASLVTVFFLPSIILATIGALGFLFFTRRGWLLASLAQLLCLGACLELYSDPEPLWSNAPVFVYPVMLYCILMVLYLNSSAVRVVFHSRREPAKAVEVESGDST